MECSRRRFVQGAVAFSISTPRLEHILPEQSAGAPVLIIVHLRGGLDGLHLLAPANDAACARRTTQLRIPGGASLPIAGGGASTLWDWRLAPAASPLVELFQEGCLAAIPACGPRTLPRGHMEAIQALARGHDSQPGRPAPPNAQGWMSRWLGQRAEPSIVVCPAHTPLELSGAPSIVRSASPCALAIATDTQRSDWARAKVASAFAGPDSGLLAQLWRTLDDARRGHGHESGTLSDSLNCVLELMIRDVPVRAAVIELHAWDTHRDQALALNRQLQSLARGLRDFAQRADELRLLGRVTLLVLTEFGRTIAMNRSGGTEHGLGSVALALGQVRPGVHEHWQALSPTSRAVTSHACPRALIARTLRERFGWRECDIGAAGHAPDIFVTRSSAPAAQEMRT